MYKKIKVDPVLMKELFFQKETDKEGFEFVENEEWQDDGKYSYSSVIFKHGDKTYACNVSRTGSYYSDYHYSFDDEAYEVEKKEVITLQWVNVKE